MNGQFLDDVDRLHLSPTLADQLAYEAHIREPAPQPPVVETRELKRRRLLDLDDAMVHQPNRPPTVAEQLEHAEWMGGRIFDLPAYFLDQVARQAMTSKRRKEIQTAQQQIGRSRR